MMSQMDNDITIEEALQGIRERAAMLRFLAEALAAPRGSVPEPPVFHGMYDVCVQIEELADKTRHSLNVDALCTGLRQPKSSRK